MQSIVSGQTDSEAKEAWLAPDCHPDKLSEHYEAWLNQHHKARVRKEGIYYTPLWLAQTLVEATLGAWLDEQVENIQHNQYPEKSMEALESLRILDPSCGTGVFLCVALERLLKTADLLCAKLPHWKASLPRRLVGVDCDPIALEITRKRLSVRVAGTSAHSWSLLCQDAFTFFADLSTQSTLNTQARTFQFILGNPPYLTEVRKQGARYTEAGERAGYYAPKMDLCDAFLSCSVNCLAPSGLLGFVLPSYWMQRSSAEPVRKQLLENGSILAVSILDHKEKSAQKLFTTAPGHHSSTLIYQKVPSDVRANLNTLSHLVSPTDSRIFVLTDPLEQQILQKLFSCSETLLKPEWIQQGIVMPQKQLRKKDWQKLPQAIQEAYPPGSGIFMLSQAEVDSIAWTPDERSCIKPYADPSALLSLSSAEGPLQNTHWLLYIDANTRRQIEAFPERYPTLYNRFNALSPILTSDFAPYGLHRPRQPEWFEVPHKIFSLRQTQCPVFIPYRSPCYVSESICIICPGGVQQTDLTHPTNWHIEVLSENWVWFWLYHHKRKGEQLQVDKDVLCSIPNPLTGPAFTPKEQRFLKAWVMQR